MKRAYLVLLPLLLGLVRCGHGKDGPTPLQGEPKPAVDPPAVCIEQLTTTVTVSGTGMSPMPTKVLEDRPQVALPGIALLLARDLRGGAAAGAPVLIPDDPAVPGQSRVRWLSQAQMSFEVFPDLKLPEGLYTVQVTNPNGHQGQWSEALLAVPRPSALRVSPDLLCSAKQGEFKLSGGMFIKRGDELPTVIATPREGGGEPVELKPARLEKCAALPGPAGLEACEEAVVTLAAGTLESGEVSRSYALTVRNPGPVGCASTESVVLTMVPAPELTKIDPEVICTAQGENSLTVTGKGFLTIDGKAPALSFDGKVFTATASGCTAVEGPAEKVESCTSLTVTVKKDELEPASYKVTVQNPPPADCVTSNTLGFAVVPPPRITALAPDIVCNAQSEITLVIEGSGFLAIGPLLPTVSLGTQEATPTLSGCTAIAGLVTKVETCTKLTVTLPQGTLSAGSYPVKVTNPAPAGCHSEEEITLTVVPPPEVVDVTPDIVCPDSAGVEVTLTGTGFLTIEGAQPSVSLDGTTLPAKASGCSAVTGPAGAVQSCTTLTLTVPQGTAAGLKNLVVTNPAPAGCASAGSKVYVSAPPTLLSVQPSTVCSDLASTTLAVTGTGILRINGADPSFTVGGKSYPPTLTGCTAIAGLKETLEACTGFTFTVLQGELAGGQPHALALKNPPPADCASSSTLSLTVVPPPTITAVSPTKLCIGGGNLVITGTGFQPGATVSLAGTAATEVLVQSGTQLTATFGAAGLVVGGPYDLEVRNPDGCSTTKTAAVTVIPGPQLFFVDPPVAYSGINTQVTMYGSGFTGNVASVGIRPAGTSAAPTPLTFTYDALKPNRVQAVVPQGIAAGTYDVVLKDQTSCDAVLPGGLKVVDKITLKLLAINPPFGYAGESTAVTVTAEAAVGGGFQPVPRLYLNPTTGTQAAGLVSVSFLDAGRVTAVVPKGLPVDVYDLIAVNPDGGVGLLPGSFEVLQLPPPVLSNITPGSIPNQAGQTVKVTGKNFRSPAAQLRCLDPVTNAETTLAPAVTASTATEVTLSVNASSLTNGAVCVVRIINGDDQSYGEYSALVVTNPAQNLTAFAAGPSLAIGRRALAAVGNQATAAARFVYVMGGDTGAVSNALDTVELAPVDIFGRPGSYFTQRNKLTTARSFVGAATVGRCIYLAGGINGSGVLTSVERGCVLDPAESPEVVDLDLKVVTTGGLGAGLWYYQVAAVQPSTHPSNPGGETLPSEPFPLLLPSLSGQKIQVTVHWGQVPGATGYRIYRSPAAGATSNALELLAAVSGTATTQYTDAGGSTQAGETPLRLGSTGKWHVAATLAAPRQGAGVAIAPDPGDTTGTKHQLYVVGGKNASTALTSYEWAPITVNADSSQTLGNFATGSATLATARWQLAAFSVGNAQASAVPPAKHYIYAGAGVASNGTTLVSSVDAFEVQAGGALGPRVTVSSLQPPRAGYGHVAAADSLFAFGALQAKPDNTVTAAKICSTGTIGCTGGPPSLANWNNAAVTMLQSRYLMGSAVQSGFIYIIGGETGTSAASSSTEYTIW